MTARSIPAEARKRLGRLLTERRVQISPAYRNRQRFVDERGLNYRLVSDIEKGRRDDFGDSTLIALEMAYGWGRGSISRVLEGDDPEPLDEEALGARWHLGTTLIRARIEQDPRFRDREVFCAERSIPYDLVVAIEDGSRKRYSAAEIRVAAGAYGLSPGEIESLGAGELEVAAGVSIAATLDAAVAHLREHPEEVDGILRRVFAPDPPAGNGSRAVSQP